MLKSQPLFTILCGEGINCERETQHALEAVGAKTILQSVHDLKNNSSWHLSTQGLVIPGGFSFGDDLGSGKILSEYLKMTLTESMNYFKTHQKPILGICNGFQTLVQMNLLPVPDCKNILTLTHNSSQQFQDRWVELEFAENSKSPWLTLSRGKKYFLPIRHGEGRIQFSTDVNAETVFKELQMNGQVGVQYQSDVNGSYQRIAGLTDPSGFIFGLMPHPEAAFYKNRSPFVANKGTKDLGDGALIFQSIINYFK